MAHKCGFTDKVLHGELKRAGFNIISIISTMLMLYMLWLSKIVIFHWKILIFY